MKKRRISTSKKIKRVLLPPQKHLNGSLYKSGGVNKPLIVTIITVVALAILSLFLLFSPQFAGKAIFMGSSKVGDAGMDLLINDLPSSETSVAPDSAFGVQVKVKVPAGSSTTAMSFKLLLPKGIGCSFPTQFSSASLYGLGDEDTLSSVLECRTENQGTPNQISYIFFDSSTLNTNLKISADENGIINLATITFSKGLPASVNTYDFQFESISVIDFATTTELVVSNKILSLTVAEPTLPPAGCATDANCPFGQTCANNVCLVPHSNNAPIITRVASNPSSPADVVPDPTKGAQKFDYIIEDEDANTIREKCSATCISNPDCPYISCNYQFDDCYVSIGNSRETILELSLPYSEAYDAAKAICTVSDTKSLAASFPVYTCGDGILESPEVCDDGNRLTPNDFCSDDCKTYFGSCGDGMVVAQMGETCDDGNFASNDGCSSACITESGYTCDVIDNYGSKCVKTQTGQRTPEICNDLTDNDGDELIDCADVQDCSAHYACDPTGDADNDGVLNVDDVCPEIYAPGTSDGCPVSCTDTDSGIDYAVAGSVVDKNGVTHVDACTADGRLTEQLCSSGGWEDEPVDCNSVIEGTACVNGACVLSESKATVKNGYTIIGDTNNNGCVEDLELLTQINSWLTGGLNDIFLLDVINNWLSPAAGCTN